VSLRAPLQDLELDAIKNPREVFGLCATSIEDALYAEDSVITVAITNQWLTTTDLLVTVKNNYVPLAQDIIVRATLAEAARWPVEVKS